MATNKTKTQMNPRITNIGNGETRAEVKADIPGQVNILKRSSFHYFLDNSLLMNSSKAGSNHFPASTVFHISAIVPCSIALFIYRNHPVHSLLFTTPLCHIWHTYANVYRI